MKLTLSLLTLFALLMMTSCTTTSNEDESNELVVGGLYLSQNENGTFGVTKILALDDFAVHIRMYSEEFKTKPTDLNSADLTFLIGHAPLAIEGFLLDKPELLKVEKVSEEELEGYNFYLEEMQNQ